MNEKDDFWDLEKWLSDKKPPRRELKPFATKETVGEYVLPRIKDAEKNSAEEEERRITVLPFTGSDSENAEEYFPAENRFLRRVVIRRLTDRFDFYDLFRKASLTYFEYKTLPCPFVPFYSYMPQYSQLDAGQKAYYFYWRDCVRRGVYPETDRSYILLYSFEILNLPDKIPPEEGLAALCDVWIAYRGRFANLDHYFAATVQDYCLLYRLPCPTERLESFLTSVLAEAPIKEFYLSDFGVEGKNGVYALTAYLSDYDWRNGKYAGGETSEEYRKHMIGALSLLLAEIRKDNFFLDENARRIVEKRNAFVNSVCTMKVKCRMEIEYYPLAQAIPLRRAVTAAVRYTENKLRALFGIKSRLGVKDLPDNYRRVIDDYFAEALAEKEKERAKQAQPAYERRYDAPEETLSILNAEEIERTSWETTARLVEGSAEEEAILPVPEKTASQIPQDKTSDKTEKNNEDIFRDAAFLAACMEGEAGAGEQKRIAAGAGLPVETIAERINVAFSESDAIGDVVLEPDGKGFYHVIEEYREEISIWLKQHS